MKSIFAFIASLFMFSTANAQFPVVPMVPIPNVQYSYPPVYYYYVPPQQPHIYYTPYNMYPQYGASLFVNGVSIDRWRRTVTIPLNVNFSSVIYYDYPTYIVK